MPVTSILTFLALLVSPGNTHPDRDTVDISTTYTIDFAAAKGAIKKVNGVNGGPLSTGDWLDHSLFFKEIDPPGIRLHDAMWPGEVVDIHKIFPDFEKDPQDPASYVFKDTDKYLQAVVGTKAEILYRLGHSAGDFGYGAGWPYPGKKPGDLQPKDFEKWIAICHGIIKHYNEGWANGFHYNITKWEIWNEANVKGWWNGAPLEFYRLYEQFALETKSKWPGLKIGGFGWVYPDPGFTEKVSASANGFVDGFLQYCSRNKVPLDFVSWHSYVCWPESIPFRSREVRAKLASFGLPNVEDYLDEWSITALLESDYGYLFDARSDPSRRRIGFDLRHGASGAAGAACILALLQDCGTSEAYYYSADANPFGMFDIYGSPYKNFYAFKAFSIFSGCSQRVSVDYVKTLACASDKFDRMISYSKSGIRGFGILASSSPDHDSSNILLSNYNNNCSEYVLRLKDLPGNWTMNEMTLNDRKDLEESSKTPLPSDHSLKVYCPPGTVILIQLKRVPPGSLF